MKLRIQKYWDKFDSLEKKLLIGLFLVVCVFCSLFLRNSLDSLFLGLLLSILGSTLGILWSGIFGSLNDAAIFLIPIMFIVEFVIVSFIFNYVFSSYHHKKRKIVISLILYKLTGGLFSILYTFKNVPLGGISLLILFWVLIVTFFFFIVKGGSKQE